MKVTSPIMVPDEGHRLFGEGCEDQLAPLARGAKISLGIEDLHQKVVLPDVEAGFPTHFCNHDPITRKAYIT